MTLMLSSSELEQLVDMPATVTVVEHVFSETALGRVLVPAPPALQLPGRTARFLPMTAVAEDPPLAVVKLLADVPENAAHALPVQRSVIVVLDAHDGTCLAILGGKVPTRERTAAASAVATRHLARPDSCVLGLIGGGELALAHLRSHLEVLDLTEVVLWSRSEATRESCRARAETIVARHRRGGGVRVRVVPTAEAVFADTDVVCTLTPSRLPLVHGAWLREGQHLNVVGAPPRPDHREVDAETLLRATVFVDDLAVALAKSGDVMIPIAEGSVTVAHVGHELGEVVAGRAIGRRDRAEITLFDSVGLGSQDLAIAHLYVEQARLRGLGTWIDLAG